MPTFNCRVLEHVLVRYENVMVEAETEEDAYELAEQKVIDMGRDACANPDTDFSGDIVENRYTTDVEEDPPQ